DDAQVDGHIYPVNSRIVGTVVSVAVKDNEHVKADTVVVQLDPRDYGLAVSRAQAELADAEAAVVAARANVPIASSTAGTQIRSDDAQVDGHIYPVNSRIVGTVVSVAVKDNEHVKADTVVVQLDPRDYGLAVSRAQAELADAEAAVVAARANVPIASSTAGTQI